MGTMGTCKKWYLALIIFLLNSIFLLANPTITIVKTDSLGNTLPNNYDNGEQVMFKVRVDAGTTAQSNLRISVPLSSITSSLDTSGNGLAFTTLINYLKSNSVGAVGTNFNSNGDFLATGVDIPANGYVEYLVLGTINPNVKDNLTITGSVTNQSGNTTYATANQTISRVPYSYTVVKTSPQTYYEKEGTITYKVTVTNTGTYAIKNLSVTDTLPADLTAATITAASTGGSVAGSYSSSGNLLATGVLINPGTSVEYTIVATVKPGVVNPIDNKATATVRNASLDSANLRLNLAAYDYSISKTSTLTNYIPNQNLTYKVRVTNNSSTVTVTKMKVEDILSTINGTAADGSIKQIFATGTVSISATSSVPGNSTGTFSVSGDLSATEVTILPNSYVEYTIVGKVNSDIVGPILNSAKATDRNAVEKTSDLTITSVAPVITIGKIQSASTYKPGDTITYTITVQNTGQGIAATYVVEDLLASITGNVANSGSTLATNINPGTLLDNWTISAALGSGSTKSTSAIISNGGTSSNQNLLDLVTVYPGEKIIYTVTAKSKDAAIGNIVNTSNLKKNSVVVGTSSVTATPVALATNSTVVITKTTNDIEYKPGDIVTYTITVTNPSSTGFMDNVAIKDVISAITATQLNGSTGPAFESWDLTVLGKTGVGTVAGTPDLVNQTGDFVTTVDIGASGTITYQLKAKVKTTTVGLIKDSTTPSGDNVPESGPGVKMSSPILEVAKNVNSTEYIPGGVLTYTLDVDNPGDGYAVNVKVEDLLSTITTQLIDGSTGPAYQSWSITSKIYDITSGSPVLVTTSSETSSSGITGTFTGNQTNGQNLSVTNAILGPGRRITYTIDVVLNSKAKGNIKNLARINNSLYTDKGSITRVGKIGITKKATGSYAIAGVTVIEYEVVVSNDASAGVALGVKVEDKISSILGELLGDSTSSIAAFSGWVIDPPVLTGPETKSTLTTSLSNVDLSDTVDISPAGSVKYTIRATLKNATASSIVYGSLKNTATADGLTATATTSPKLPNLVVNKTAITPSFISGVPVTFKVTVTNTGDGYANDAIIADALDSTMFENIAITATSLGLGTTTGITGTLTSNLNTTVDIAPGGKVEYLVTANVKASYLGNTVSNTVSVTDKQNSLTTTASATIDRDLSIDGKYIDFQKRSNTTVFRPGETVTYYIDITNKLPLPRTVTVKDLISSIKADYANDLSVDNTVDMLNQQAFDSWVIYGAQNNLDPNTQITTSPIDLNNTVVISGGSTYTYKIVGNVNPRVVSQKLTNTATLLDETASITLGTASVQHNIVPPGGGITRTVDKVRYIPGVDKVKYTITVTSTGPGYQNNVNINELIKNLSVDLIDGTTGFPFQDPSTGLDNFTVTKVVTPQTDGTEESFTSGIANNQNLVGTVDVKPGETLQYVIEGYVRKDAIGTINNGGLITEPYRYNLQNTKSVSPSKYEPGQYITYTVTVRNNSVGNAKDILVQDNLGVLSVVDSTGATITPALTDISVDLANSTATGYKATLGNPTITNGIFTATPDIPTGGVIIYKIKAKVADKAVGYITNVITVDGDSVSNQVGPTVDKPGIKKEVVAFYKADGSVLAAQGYMAGGYIEYKVTLSNTGKGILNNGAFIDDLGAITTNYFNGTTGPAFDSWVITLVSSTGISTIPDINGSVVLGTATTTGINTLVDIHPGGEIVYKIKAKLNEKVTGSVVNKATINGLGSSVTTNSVVPTITHTKEAYEANGTTVKTTFLPGDDVVYKIKVTNIGYGISALQTYKDLVGSIIGEVAETATSGEAPTESVFASYTATYTTSGGNVTGVGTFNQTIQMNSSVSIAPGGGWIEFVITGKLKDTVIGAFTNTSEYGTNKKTKTLNPVATTLVTSKRLKSLNGVPFTTGMTYKPGDTVEYEVSIENTGNSFSNDLKLSDNTDSIVTSLSGDITGKALESIVFSSPVVTNSVGKTVLTNIKPAVGNTSTNLQVEMDLAPKDKVVYTVSGKIVKSAIGVIPANIATVGGTNYSSAAINPTAPNISTKKELISPSNKIYGPAETVQYRLTIENTGDGFGDDIKILDEISKIKTLMLNGTQGQAFTSWTAVPAISYSDSSYNGQTILQNTLVNNQDINTEVDIAPKSKLEILITATTSSLAVGDITNTAKLNGTDKTADTISPRVANVEFAKIPLVTGNTTYVPNGNIGFRLVLMNNSTNAIAKDINLIDEISKIKVTAIDGSQVQAFQTGWTMVVVSASGDTTKYSVTGVPSTGDITAGKLTIAPGEIVAVRIEGKVNEKAVGDIINEANASYNGAQLGPKSVTFTSLPGTVKLTKTADKANYITGDKVTYTISVKNDGQGYLNDISIVDDLKLIETTIAGGTTGKVFTDYTVKSVTKSNALTLVTQDTSYANGYKASADIYPGDTVTIILEATVNPLATGVIENTAKVTGPSITPVESKVSLVPLPADVKIMKTVDKATYISGDELTYKITVGNIGTGWADGVNVIDEISKIKAKLASDLDVAAFESWTINWALSPGSAQVFIDGQTFPASNQDLNVTLDLAPMAGIEFTIKAKLTQNIVSDVINKASYQYKTDTKTSNEVVSKLQVIPLTIQKVQENMRSGEGPSTNPIKYWLQDEVEYTITVTAGDSPSGTFDIVDNLSSILVAGSGGHNITAFTSWSVTSAVGSLGTVPTIISSSNQDVKVTTTIQAHETITVKVRAKITAGDSDGHFPQATIKNTAQIVQDNKSQPSNEVILTPYPPVIQSSKVITSIDGKPYVAGDTYEPGQVVVYTITVKNIGEGVADNIPIVDNLSLVTTELAGGGTGPAFSSWNISVVKHPSIKLESGSFGEGTNGVVNAVVDIGPNTGTDTNEKSVVITITAIISDNAIGVISPNVLHVNGGDNPTDPIPPKAPTAPTFDKKVLQDTSYVDSGKYTQSGVLEYKITISNPNSKLWLNDVIVQDTISQIMATDLNGNSVKAFKAAWTITKSDLSKGSVYSGTYPKVNVDLNETIDIAPLDTVTFIIRAEVKDTIVGSIENTAKASYLNGATRINLPDEKVVCVTDPGTINITKVPFEEYYVAGTTIGYDIVVENTSATHVVNNLVLTDIISAITNPQIGSPTNVASFESGWTISYQVIGDTVNTNTTSILPSGDINGITLDIGKSTKIIIKIRGTAKNGIYGNIVNKVSYSYPDGAEGNKEGQAEATIKPKNPHIILDKTVNKVKYSQHDEIIYTLKLKNDGTGPAIKVDLIDPILTIQTDLAGDPSTGNAFDSWTRESLVVPPTSNVNSEIITGDTYKLNLDMAAGDEVTVTIKAILNDKDLGEIINIASGTYRDGDNKEKSFTDQVSITGEGSNLFISKTIDKVLYENKDIITFNLILQNGGLGWGNNVIVQDKISEITDELLATSAFESWSIAVQKSSPLSAVTPELPPANQDLDVLLDIAPLSQVKFIITAKLKADVSSILKNKGLYKLTAGSEPVYSNTVQTAPIPGNLSVVKSAIESRYTPGGDINYKIEVTNSANVLIRDVEIKDILSTILVTTNLPSSTEKAFTEWTLLDVVGDKGSIPGTTLPAKGVATSTVDLDILTNLKANETMTITIAAKVNAGNVTDGVPLGDIANKVVVTHEGKDIYDSVVTPTGSDSIEVTKKLIKPTGTYTPGEAIEYEIVVTNTGTGVANDVKIFDALTNVKVEVAGGIFEEALTNRVVTISTGKPTSVVTPNSVSATSDIDVLADIDVNDYVKIVVKGDINPKAVGVIDKNIVTAGNVSAQTPEINPKKGDLTFTKEIVGETEYTQDGTIKYRLTITNTTDVFVNDASFKDLISMIRAKSLDETLIQPFATWSFTRTDKGVGSVYSQAGSLTNTDIDTSIDVAPRDIIIYEIEATVKSNIVGKIENSGYLEFVSESGVKNLEEKVVSNPKIADVNMVKVAGASTYNPDGEISFAITVTNVSKDAVANNVLVTDMISEIVAKKIGGGEVAAFKPGWTITASISGDTVNTNIANILSLGNGSDLENVLIDIGKDTSVTITIKGFAASNIYGVIKNTASFSYTDGNQSATKEATIDNIFSVPELTKSVDITEYKPGDILEYSIKIKNPGTTVVPSFLLSDEIGKITATVSGETNPALVFDSWSRVSVVIPSTSSIAEGAVLDSTAGDTYTAELDIAPGDEIVITLKGTLKLTAIGEVINIAKGRYVEKIVNDVKQYKDIEDDAKSTTKTPELSIVKDVDKAFYVNDDTLVYTIMLKNSGLGWANDVLVEDKISAIKDSVLNETAFASWNIEVFKSNSLIDVNPALPPANTDLSVLVDIAPKSEVIFRITGVLKDNVTSELKNHATFTEKDKPSVDSNEVVSKSIPGDLSIIKDAVEYFYTPGEKLTYVIKVKNHANIHLNDVVVTDALNNLKVSTNIAGKTINPFTEWKVVSVSTDKGTTVKSFEPQNSSTTDVKVVTDLDPEETLEIRVEAIVSKGTKEDGVPTGVIENIATATHNNIDVFDSNKRPTGKSKVEVEKKINSIGGVAYTGQTYNPGEIVQYEILVKNTGLGMAKGVEITDALSSIMVEIAGGTQNKAFTNWSTVISTDLDKLSVVTPASLSDSTDIDLIADIAVGDTVKIVIDAQINPLAVGRIAKNVVNASDSKAETPPIDSAKGKLTLTKVVDGDLTYTQGGTIIYKIAVENSTAAFVNDATLVDMISTIKAKSLDDIFVSAFSSWTVTKSDLGKGSTYTQTGTIVDINTKMDVAPGDKIIYTVEAIVNENIVGDIENSATLTYDTNIVTESVISKPLLGDVSITKDALSLTYTPNGEIGFDIKVSNIASNVANNVVIRDMISEIMGTKAGGGTAAALKPGWTINVKVAGSSEDIALTNVSNLTALPAGSDIDNVSIDMGKNTVVTIEIRGVAAQNISGEIENIASFKYPDKNEEGNDNAKVNPESSKLSIEKEVDKDYYIEKDTLIYTVTLKNTGLGWANNVLVEDKISEILDIDLNISAFSSWTVGVSKTDALTVVNPATPPVNTDLSVLVDIAPQSEVVFTITGKLAANVTSILKNKATFTENKNTENEKPPVDSNEVESKPIPGDLSIVKEVLNSKYTPGGKVTYTIKVQNHADIHLEDVVVTDALNDLLVDTNIAGKSIVPFKEWKVVSVVNSMNSEITSFVPVNSEATDVKVIADLNPDEILTIVVEAVVSLGTKDDGVPLGTIKNIAVATQDKISVSDSVTINSGNGDVTVNKTIKTLGGVPFNGQTYKLNDEIEYEIKVQNIGDGVANDIKITDELSKLMVEVAGGTFEPMLESWSVSIETGKETTVVAPRTVDSNTDINLTADIDVEDTVTIVIKGRINKKAIGKLPKNIVKVDNKTSETPEVDPTSGDLEFTKEIVDGSEYTQLGTITYKLTIKNISDVYLNDVKFKDVISSIKTKVLSGAEELAFSNWTVARTDLNKGSIYTQNGDLINTDIDTTVDIAPNDEITYIVVATVVESAIGDIINTASVKYEEKEIEKEVVSTLKPGRLTLIKSVIPTRYIPGEDVEYTITVANPGGVWIRNALLEDMFSEVKTTVFGRVEGAAFEENTLNITYTTSDPENTVTLLEQQNNLRAEIDIKNGTSISFIAKVKVSKDAASFIENIARVSIVGPNGTEVIEAKATIYAQLPEIKLKKTVDKDVYEAKDAMIYTISLENTGDTNVNGIVGKDILKNIRSLNNLGEFVYPFEDGVVIDRVITPEGSILITSETEGDGNISDILNMRPKSKITYTVSVKVKDGIVGKITNIVTASIPNQGEEGTIELIDEVETNPLRPNLTINKSVVTELEGDNGIVNGEKVTYTIQLLVDRPIFNVKLIDEVVNLKAASGEALFDPASIKLISVQENGSAITYSGDISSTSSEIKIGRIDKEAIIVLEGVVNSGITLVSQEKIVNIAKANYDQENDGVDDLEQFVQSTAEVVASAPQLELTKVAEQDEVLLGDVIEYKITVKNTGAGVATNFTVIDNISDIIATSNSGSKVQVYTDWSVTAVAGSNSSYGTLPPQNTNLNISDAFIGQNEEIIYTIKAKTSLNIDVKKVENIAVVKSPGVKDLTATAEVKVKKPLITIDKEAGVRETSVGRFVPYSLVITNNENQQVKNIYIKDTPPAGFEYVEGSIQVVQNGEKVGTIPAKYVGSTVVVGPFDLDPRQQIEVVYLTKVSIGVVRGVYKNVAVVTNSSGTPVSNEDTAEVDVVEDPLFETTTVIGKVFHDRDGDGTQDDNRATGVAIKQDIPLSSYVANSTYYVMNGVRKSISDKSVPLERGIKFKEVLHGRGSEREELQKNKIEIYTGLTDISKLGDIKVTTAEGTDITLTKDNKVITNHKNLKAKGMVSQNIVVKREILKRSTFKNSDNKVPYYQKITIINTGLLEEGIPGVRVTNVEGLVIITDQYGRFHIPEVSDRKGKNYILKVDAATLPAGSIFTTENPKVQRLGTTTIKYNFGVVLPRTTFETTKDGTRLLRVKVYPGVLFYDNSSDIKPVVYENLFREIMKKLKSKDHLLIELNRSGDLELDKKRSKELRKLLSNYLSKEKVEIQFVNANKGGEINE